jgi:hypothetical protein
VCFPQAGEYPGRSSDRSRVVGTPPVMVPVIVTPLYPRVQGMTAVGGTFSSIVVSVVYGWARRLGSNTAGIRLGEPTSSRTTPTVGRCKLGRTLARIHAAGADVTAGLDAVFERRGHRKRLFGPAVHIVGSAWDDVIVHHRRC